MGDSLTKKSSQNYDQPDADNVVIHTIRPQLPKRKASGNSDELNDEFEFTFDSFQKTPTLPEQQSTDRESNPSRASGLSDESVEFVLVPPPAQGIPSENFDQQPTRTPTPPMQAPAPPKQPRNYNRSKPVQKRKDPARMVLPAPTPLS